MVIRLKRKRANPEEAMQKTCVEWLAIMEKQGRLKYVHVPNKPRNAVQGRRLKEMGMRSGFPDMILFFRDSKAVFVELKADGGRESDNQEEWLTGLHDFGFPVHLCRSLADMQIIVARYNS